MMKQAVPPNIMATGMVRIHAFTISPAKLHFTADKRFALPAPMTEAVITWVVLTGAPMNEAVCRTSAADVWAANPLAG